MKVIYAGAGMLILLALWAFWLALQLIPTDLGNSYMVASSVLFSAAFVMIAVARAGRMITTEIRSLPQSGNATLAAPPVMPPPMEPPVMAPPVIPPAMPAVAPVVAGMAAGAALGAATRTTPEPLPEPKVTDPLERDLFADLKFTPPPASPTLDDPVPTKAEPAFDAPAAPLADTPNADQPQLDDPPLAPSAFGEPEDSALLQPRRPAPADTGEDDDLALPELPPIPRLGEPEPPPFAMDEERRAIEEAAHHDDDGDDRAPMPAAPEPVAPPVSPALPTSGLIHDEDLARLSEAEADLAPLETLEVVGAYDSGGTRFTMYSDGSVTAKGHDVDRRFRSLDDLRAFIDGGMRG